MLCPQNEMGSKEIGLASVGPSNSANLQAKTKGSRDTVVFHGIYAMVHRRTTTPQVESKILTN